MVPDMRHVILSGLACVLLGGLPTVGRTEQPQPAKAMTPLVIDKLLLDTLKDVHNRGAEFFNTGDHAGALRMYHGGLIVAKPLLAHRPTLQKLVTEGLTEIEVTRFDAKTKAFRLHEVIASVRDQLKEDVKIALTPPSPPAPPKVAALSGKVLLFGKSAGDLTISIFKPNVAQPIATTKSKPDGSYRIETPLDVGTHVVTLTGANVPAAYTKPETSPLKVELKSQVNDVPLDLK
jgi:hypothetical protein